MPLVIKHSLYLSTFGISNCPFYPLIHWLFTPSAIYLWHGKQDRLVQTQLSQRHANTNTIRSWQWSISAWCWKGQTQVWQTQRQDPARGTHDVSKMDKKHMATHKQNGKGNNWKRKARNLQKAKHSNSTNRNKGCKSSNISSSCKQTLTECP